MKISKEFDPVIIEAFKNYHSPHCSSVGDFKTDLNIFLSIKKQIKKYKTTGELNERLLLNNVIILTNVFSIKFVCETLLLMLDEFTDVILPVLEFLNYLDPEEYYKKHGRSIVFDRRIVEILQKI